MATERKAQSHNDVPASDPGSEAWVLMQELFQSERHRWFAIAGEFGLSPVQAHALSLLEPDRPRPMSELAETLHCDASNVTGIADRLEAHGLVERQSAAGDRRVKTLQVTPAGIEARTRVWARMREAPASIAALSDTDQRALRDLLKKAMER